MYVIRGGPVEFKLPDYEWTPMTCSKQLSFRLAYVDFLGTGKYPRFIKVNLDKKIVTLNGNELDFEYANREFRFQLFVETDDTDRIESNDYNFVIKTIFKNSPPRFVKNLESTRVQIGDIYEVTLPRVVDDDGDDDGV